MGDVVEMEQKGLSVFSAAKSIGEYGLVTPADGLTDDQHNEIGELLGRIESAGAWNRGDWYNGEPKSQGGRPEEGTVVNFTTVKDKCTKYGLNQSNTIKEAATCTMFPDEHVRRKLTYSHFALLRKMKGEYPGLDADKFVELASVGDRYLGEFDDTKKYRKQPWTAAQLQRAILIEMDDLHDVDTKAVDDAEDDALKNVRAILDDTSMGSRIKAKVVKEIDVEIKAAFGKLKDDFHAQVQDAAKKERSDLQAERKRLSSERVKFENSNKSVDAFMSKSDYKLILGCLHPDKVPEDDRQRYARAFDLFRVLKDDTNIR